MTDDILNYKGAKKSHNLSKRPSKPFRLEQSITLASSDKYNDPYECEVTARKLRERYVVSVTITHDPVTTRVYSNSWIFKDMSTCWDKFHAIAETISDIRNFIEAEGLKSVVFQYMVKHALSNVAADVENIYESNLYLTRNVIDESTRGNLIKNLPTVPFRTQSGPDQLDSVYTSVGNAENPVPEDGIRGESQLALPQHMRQQIGLKDVFPAPISKFQEAAGIRPEMLKGMIKGASSNKEIKTGATEEQTEQDKISEFIQGVKDNASNAIEFGKNQATKHYMNMTGAKEDEADAFYHGVKALCSESKIVLNASATGLLVFMAHGEYCPVHETPELTGKFNHNAAKREQAERAIGCFGLMPTYANVTLLEEGDRNYGKLALRLANIGDSTVLVCGDTYRTRSPARPDYVADAKMLLYPFFALADCKATSIILAMGKHDLAAGPAVAVASILERDKEFGRCEALIFAPVRPENIKEIVAASADASKTIRKILMRLGKTMAVKTSTRDPKIISPGFDKEFDDDPMVKNSVQQHFCLADRVTTKRTAQNPCVMGTIVDVSNGQITVEWDNQKRSIFDQAEALFRLIAAPKQTPLKQGMVVYQLPGMDEETLLTLSTAGIDPVSLYSLMSHHKPVSGEKKGLLDQMIISMESLGLHGHKVIGYVPTTGGDDAFRPHEWIQAKLPTGVNLTIDLNADTPVIKVGEAVDYIEPDINPRIQIE